MGNLISRPSCLGQKSKHVRSDEAFLKECYQRRREWQLPENHGDAKQEVSIKDAPKEDSIKEEDLECDNELEELDLKREEETHTPISEKPLRSSPASTIRSTSTLENAWHSSPSPIKTSRNGTLTRRSMPPEYTRSPLAHPDRTAAERRASFQRRDSREGSPWSWKTLSSREVTEVTEVTETTVTEIVEVTEYPTGDKGGDPIVTRTVRVLNGVAEELAEVYKNTYFQTPLGPSVLLSFLLSSSNPFILTFHLFDYMISEWVPLKWSFNCLKLVCYYFCSSKAMGTQALTRTLAWIDGGYVLTFNLSIIMCALLKHSFSHTALQLTPHIGLSQGNEICLGAERCINRSWHISPKPRSFAHMGQWDWGSHCKSKTSIFRGQSGEGTASGTKGLLSLRSYHFIPPSKKLFHVLSQGNTPVWFTYIKVCCRS